MLDMGLDLLMVILMVSFYPFAAPLVVWLDRYEPRGRPRVDHLGCVLVYLTIALIRPEWF